MLSKKPVKIMNYIYNNYLSVFFLEYRASYRCREVFTDVNAMILNL